MRDLKCRYAFGKECQITVCKYEPCDYPLVYQQGRADMFNELKIILKLAMSEKPNRTLNEVEAISILRNIEKQIGAEE